MCFWRKAPCLLTFDPSKPPWTLTRSLVSISLCQCSSFVGQGCTGGDPLSAARVDRRGDGGEGWLVNSAMRVYYRISNEYRNHASPSSTEPPTLPQNKLIRLSEQTCVSKHRSVTSNGVRPLNPTYLHRQHLSHQSSLWNNRDYLVSWYHLEKGDQLVCLLKWGDMLAGFTKRLGFLFL